MNHGMMIEYSILVVGWDDMIEKYGVIIGCGLVGGERGCG